MKTLFLEAMSVRFTAVTLVSSRYNPVLNLTIIHLFGSRLFANGHCVSAGAEAIQCDV